MPSAGTLHFWFHSHPYVLRRMCVCVRVSGCADACVCCIQHLKRICYININDGGLSIFSILNDSFSGCMNVVFMYGGLRAYVLSI